MNKNTKEKPYCIYRHLTPDGIVFYIGIGNNLKRPYATRDRSKDWKELIQECPNYEVQILTTGLTKEEACEFEILLIAYYKRADCCGGTLVNLTNGGESTHGRIMADWQREKMSREYKGKFLGEDNPNFSNYWTNEQKKYMSDLKKEGHRNGTLSVNKEALERGRLEKVRRWTENPQLKDDMRKRVSENHNLYQYLKIDRVTKEILETFENRLEILEKNPDYKTSPLLSACNGWKASYKGFLWRYRIRETGEIIDPEYKRCKK